MEFYRPPFILTLTRVISRLIYMEKFTIVMDRSMLLNLPWYVWRESKQLNVKETQYSRLTL